MSTATWRLQPDGRAPIPWVRRGVVLLVALGWALLASPLPTSLQGAGIAVVGTMVAFTVGLDAGMGWLVFAPRAKRDERECQLRDRAFQYAFRGLALGILLQIVSHYVATIMGGASYVIPAPFAGGARGLVAVLLLLALLPTLTAAWLMPTRVGDYPEIPPVPTRRSAAIVLAGTLAAGGVIGIWLLAISALPVRTVTLSQVPAMNVASAGARCGNFSVYREVGDGLGATVALAVDVCWNRRGAWIVDPGFISPNPYAIPKQPQPTNCSVSADSTDFEMVATQVCAQQGHAGTVRMATHARVSPGLSGLFERTIKLAVVIGAKGRVIHLG
jgi:hypothetical protein